jgi:S-adenosylmethionine hydrolase
MNTKIITLTTDFGLKDPYVAEMKAAIVSICPDAVIVDITHEVKKFDIRMGAFMLACAAPYFPKGTIHVAVVDPDVGTKRRPLVMSTSQGIFVGPDNGVLVLAALKQDIIGAREITNPKLMLPNVSNTFHGRDVFAPAAAKLANDVPPNSFGPEISEVIKPDFSKVIFDNGALMGEVLHVDGFGNVITNIDARHLGRLHAKDMINVKLRSSEMMLKLGKSYAEVNPKEALVLLGSQGYVEIAVNQGNAARKFKAKPGDKITLSAI